jgi:hypothetical protein
MGIRHCRKIELGGVANICGMMEGQLHYTSTAPIAQRV